MTEDLKKPRVRFAPSPTGYLHVGGARSALFNWLFARHTGGTFILRIEDTDQSRYNETALHDLMRDLKWLGMAWDEGPDVGGPHAPYTQSERLPLYQAAAKQLLDTDQAYRCFCTSDRLTALREVQEAAKQPTGYDRHCRDLSRAESDARAAAGEPHVIRLRTPLDGETKFSDLLRGEIVYQNAVLDDLVLLKTDLFPTYHLASVVDDHAMEITHVLRGDEWIPSTPRHVLLYKAFGWEPPIFCHLPVILAPGGGKFSKRKGAASIGEYCDRGYMPEALFNFLALLGWSPGDEREKMSLQEMIEAFDLHKIHPKSAAFDEVKLEWLNGQYLGSTPAEELMPAVKLLLEARGYGEKLIASPETLLKHVSLLKDRSKRLDELVDTGLYFWDDPTVFDEKTVKKYWTPEAIERLRGHLVPALEAVPHACWTIVMIEDLYKKLSEQLGCKFADLIHPTRLVLSGIPFGPGLFELMEALGKETVITRMRHAVSLTDLPVAGT